MMLYIWSAVGVLFALGFLFTRFRPFVSLAAGFVSAAAASLRFNLAVQIGVLLLGSLAFGFLLKPAFRRLRRLPDDPEALGIVGFAGKIRDVVNARGEIFLLHCEGRDWIAYPETAGGVALGDDVEVVRVVGKAVHVRRTN
ncbi:MAG: hypothetical protein KA419_04290 [Acidobacteria bacterium]|nr:hypothetical protein [Acidobacteriota bacterium]